MAVVLLAWDPPRGAHRRVRVFVGPDRDHLALTGDLTFREAEADQFRSTIRQGVQGPGFTGMFERGWEEPSGRVYRGAA